MRPLLIAAALYLSLLPLIAAGAFCFGYFYSAGVELYYYNNPLDTSEASVDFSTREDARYLM